MNDPSHTLIVGMTGSGKTTFELRYLFNAACACRFLFDWNERFTERIGKHFRVSYTEAELESSLSSRWSIFNPRRVFPGAAFDRKVGVNALRWWCAWVSRAAKRGRGKKFVVVPELWRFCTEDSIPTELALLAQDGRQDEVELVIDTQRPDKLNPSIVGAVTELVCFRLDEREALRAIGHMRAEPERVASLPMGSFISYNRLAPLDDPGRTLAGKVF